MPVMSFPSGLFFAKQPVKFIYQVHADVLEKEKKARNGCHQSLDQVTAAAGINV
jgi:hypothetical protein